MPRFDKNASTVDTSINKYLTAERLKGFIEASRPSYGGRPYTSSKMLNNTQAFINSANRYGINLAYFFCHAINESAWGLSNFAIQRNNFWGFKAYDSDPNQAEVFQTVEDGTNYCAKFMKDAYFSPSGFAYKRAVSMGKTPATINGMAGIWWTSTTQADTIVTIMNNLMSYLEKIGVRLDQTQPAPAQPAPQTSGNSGEFVTVQSGWGLSNVAKSAGMADYGVRTSWDRIAQLNGFSRYEDMRLFPGQVVRVKSAPQPQTPVVVSPVTQPPIVNQPQKEEEVTEQQAQDRINQAVQEERQRLTSEYEEKIQSFKTGEDAEDIEQNRAYQDLNLQLEQTVEGFNNEKTSLNQKYLDEKKRADGLQKTIDDNKPVIQLMDKVKEQLKDNPHLIELAKDPTKINSSYFKNKFTYVLTVIGMVLGRKITYPTVVGLGGIATYFSEDQINKFYEVILHASLPDNAKSILLLIVTFVAILAAIVGFFHDKKKPNDDIVSLLETLNPLINGYTGAEKQLHKPTAVEGEKVETTQPAEEQKLFTLSKESPSMN